MKRYVVKERLVERRDILQFFEEKIYEQIFSKIFKMQHKHNKSIQYVPKNIMGQFPFDFSCAIVYLTMEKNNTS